MRVTASRRWARVRPERRGAHEKNARRDGLRGLGLHLRRREDAARLRRADTGSAPREVHGESCRNAVGLPLFLWGGWDLGAWGDAGYRDAVAKAQAQAPGSTLSDVRADVHFINILVWRQECLVVTAAAR